MSTASTEEELLQQLRQAVVSYDKETTIQLCRQVVAAEMDAARAVRCGLAAGMDQVGQLYNRQEYFVPELLLCADALYAGLETLQPHVVPDSGEKKRRIVLGTIEGDVHDIGKNLVKVMFDAAGWAVHDLGRDVALERFVTEQERTGADVVGVSALMTTSMRAMPELVKMLRSSAPRVAIMLGGAPVTRPMALQFGADGYAENAGCAVQEATRLLQAGVPSGKKS